jgi:hypothetical protein
MAAITDAPFHEGKPEPARWVWHVESLGMVRRLKEGRYPIAHVRGLAMQSEASRFTVLP